MKKIFYLSLNLTFLFLITSCSKENVATNSKNFVNSVEISSSNDMDFKDFASTIHNSYLAYTFENYNSGILNTNKEITNVEMALNLCRIYFEQNSDFNLNDWPLFETMIHERFYNPMPLIQQNRNFFYEHATGAIQMYGEKILNLTDAILFDEDLFDLYTDSLNSIFNEIVLDESVDSLSKNAIFGLLGVCSGSFEYWSNNILDWTNADWYNTEDFSGMSTTGDTSKPNNNNNNNNNNTETKTTKEKIAEFVNADATGAGVGMAAGSMLAGVGAAPGAVLMGSFCSGVVAWSW